MAPQEAHVRYIRRAIELARRAAGRTHPNPMVGCVIVDGEGRVVAEGYHHRAGEAHAEVEALRLLSDQVDASNCTLYVNLEPCSHHNLTPPCSDAICAAGIGRVVVGTIDPNPRVRGRGIAQLREAGVEVVSGVLEDECLELNRAFFKYITEGLPLVVAKYAMTLDGKIAARTGDSKWITSEESRRVVHELRNETDAILIGTGTLAADDPRLSCRIDGGRDPVRVLIDARLDHAPAARAVRENDSGVPVIVFVSEDVDEERVASLEGRGSVEIVRRPVDAEGKFDPGDILQTLSAHYRLTSVLVEGGGALLGALFDADLIDRVYAFVAPRLVGGALAPSPLMGRGLESMADAAALENVSVSEHGPDLLIVGDIKRS